MLGREDNEGGNSKDCPLAEVDNLCTKYRKVH
jgi:hypothetical protein